MSVEHQMGHCDPDEAASAAMHVVDALQNHRPGCQAMAIGLVFLATCARYGIEYPVSALAYAGRFLGSQDGDRPEIRAVRAYAANELP